MVGHEGQQDAVTVGELHRWLLFAPGSWPPARDLHTLQSVRSPRFTPPAAGRPRAYAAPGVTRYASNTASMFRSRVMAWSRVRVSPTSTTNRFLTIG